MEEELDAGVWVGVALVEVDLTVDTEAPEDGVCGGGAGG